jgi:hypothetical protein|tara:strand:- start:1523 stop:1777 length:255 start_codon:yes stop_codon:yes gene_type:complete
MENLKVLVLDNIMLLTQIEEVSGDLGTPDCKLTEPMVIGEQDTLSPWLVGVTSQNTFMIHSDKILTIAQPNSKLEERYKSLVKE